MKINMIINGENKKVKIPFWDAFKVFMICYLAFLGMIFLVGFFIGLFF
jgi:hypothetical protein